MSAEKEKLERDLAGLEVKLKEVESSLDGSSNRTIATRVSSSKTPFGLRFLFFLGGGRGRGNSIAYLLPGLVAPASKHGSGGFFRENL